MFPKIDLPRYVATLPSSGKEFSYRPFTVKEQKILLLANESTNEKEKLLNLKTVISECTYGSVNTEELPLFDLEYVMLLLRAKSVGEIIEVQVACSNCKKANECEINIDDIKVNKSENHSTTINLTDELGITMKYPTMEIESALQESKDGQSIDFKLIASCVENVFDKKQVYPAKNNLKMVEEFLDSLDITNFEKILNFFYTMPQISHTVKYECRHCKTQNQFEVRGLTDFFA